jgi:hypothetical protein
MHFSAFYQKFVFFKVSFVNNILFCVHPHRNKFQGSCTGSANDPQIILEHMYKDLQTLHCVLGVSVPFKMGSTRTSAAYELPDFPKGSCILKFKLRRSKSIYCFCTVN